MSKSKNNHKNNTGKNSAESTEKEKIESKENADAKEKREQEKHRDERIEETGQTTIGNIHLITIIGEVEGHDNLGNNAKTTKYEHILPQLAAIEDSREIQGLLVLLNTMGGDVEAGLAIAEMIGSLSKPTVSLVLGGSHSIGVPIATSTDYSFIVPTGTMVIHPVRMNGMVIGAPQTFDYFKQMQDRITGFVCSHCKVTRARMEEMMMATGILTKDVGTILVGEEAVKEGLINEVGGIKEAMSKLYALMGESR
ncbi:ATP-dependent Clp protease proteolytic subunit [Lachnospiraceae bacterium JLR.KK008]